MSLFNLPTFEEKDLQGLEPLESAEIPFEERREQSNKRSEEDAGIFKPLVQLYNVGTSPDMNVGAGIGGAVNAASKLTNALGDVLFKNKRGSNPFVSFMEGMLVEGELQRRGDLVDTSDAWLISDDVRRSFRKPMWDGEKGGFVPGDQLGVTPADEFALPLSGDVVGETAAIIGGYGVLKRIKQTAFFAYNAKRFRNLQAVKNIAVAAQGTSKGAKALRTGIKGTQLTAEAAFEQLFATPFLDRDNGNFFDMFPESDILRLLGQTREGDNYLDKVRSGFTADLAPLLGVTGFGTLTPGIRRFLTNDLGWVDAIGKAEIDPYIPHINKKDPLALSPYQKGGSITPTEPGPISPAEKGGAIVEDPAGAMVKTPVGAIRRYDSAISRSLAEQTQVNQVKAQRERLKNMGLTEIGDGNQLELSVGKVVEPEVKAAIEQIRRERNALIRRASETGEDLTTQFDELDKYQEQVLFDGYTDRQLNFPDKWDADPRPEVDTYLANLDELGDDQLRTLFSEVSAPIRRQKQLETIQIQTQKVSEIQAAIDEIPNQIELGTQNVAEGKKARAGGGYTERGGKRKLNDLIKELGDAQRALDELQESGKVQRPLVGDQLKLVIDEGVAPDSPASKADWPDQDFDFKRRFLDEKGLNRFIAALDRTFGHEWINEPVERVGDMLNFVNLARVATEEGVKKAGRDLNSLAPLAKDLLKQARKAKKKIVDPVVQGIKDEFSDELIEVERPILPKPEEIDNYREFLSSLNRDDLRPIAGPSKSPEVAAIVKQRTGRRVWEAKKIDIINAFVEVYERTGRQIKGENQLDLKLGKTRTTTPLTKLVDSEGVEYLAPTGEYIPRGMGEKARETMKADILKIAIENGEIQAPVTPLPDVPTTNFNQGSFIADLLSDESGQIPFLYATDQLPTYKAGGKNAGAIVEEMRLRYEYLLKDLYGQKAIREAQMAFEGWDTMTWEQKKSRLGSINTRWGERFNPELEIDKRRTMNRYRKEGVTKAPTKVFKGELDYSPIEPTAPRSPKRPPDAWTPDGPVPKEVADKPKPPEVKKAEKKVDTNRTKEINTNSAQRKLDLAALRKQREDLLNNSKGANC